MNTHLEDDGRAEAGGLYLRRVLVGVLENLNRKGSHEYPVSGDHLLRLID